MEAEIVDSLLISRFDSVYTYPEEMETEFRQAQKGLTDSSAYYKLELFTGYCLYLRGYQDSAVHLNQKVLDFCKQHPGTDALEATGWNHRYALLQGINQKDSSIACLHHAYNAIYRSDDHKELESICINLADAYCQTRRSAAGCPILQESLMGGRFTAIQTREIQHLYGIGSDLCQSA